MSDRRVIFSRQFTQEFKRLQKRYRHISDDLHTLLDLLKQGETPGDQIPGVGYPAYKVRVQNRDVQSGKRGGYRIIYYLRLKNTLFLVTIYSKRDRDNISGEEIRHLIQSIESEIHDE